MSNADAHRLPTGVIPSHYRLDLIPDLEGSSFTGSVTISIEVVEPANIISLHALDLDIHSATLRTERDGSAHETEVAVTVDRDVEMVRLECAEVLQTGAAELHFEFSGELNDQLVGFYRSTMTVDGTEHRIAVTQFESTHARRAFPCFDEPEFKASFGVTLTVPSDLLAVSNAAEVSRSREEQSEGATRSRITFADTMPMSTYLVAFVIGPLEATEPRLIAGLADNVPLRVIHPPGMGHLSEFALEVADAAVRFFERYYEIPYPGDKIDLVAVPDFAFGAMENLGCITFREVLLLVDPATATKMELQRVADVINHELAHMWFGDLVTMKWWNGIWLNEAFATFMETSASDAFNPDWDVWTNFGLARAAAFDTDSLHSTRPIEYEVITAADSEGMFDILTYEKGCGVVRMLEQYLGPETFRNGIRAYLRDNSYGNTETTDLWDALEEVSGEPVRRIMDSWIFQGGHPQVEVGLDNGIVTLTQRRALLTPDRAGRAESPTWPIPMVLETTDTNGDTKTLRILQEEPSVLEVDSEAVTVQANAGGNGFYRSLPDHAMRMSLADSEASAVERFVLLDDSAFALMSGQIEISELTAVVDVVAGSETSPAIWRRIAGIADQLVRLTIGDQRREIRDWAVNLAIDARPKFGEARAASGDEAEVIAVLLNISGVTAADEIARGIARDLVNAPDVDPSITASALKVVASSASADEHADIEDRWRNPESPQAEQRALGALVATGDPELFKGALNLAADEVRSQDAPYMLRQALQNLDLAATAWDNVEANWDLYNERFPASALPRMLEGIRGFTDPDLADRVEKFLSSHPLPAGDRQVAQHREWMAANVVTAARLRA